jgi:peptide chain release factor 3
VHDLANPELDALLSPGVVERAREEVALLDAAGPRFSREAVLAGGLTPVFFGSAVNTFGVDALLGAILDLAPAPGPRPANGRFVEPQDPGFSGFVFKIQANVDPRHRDRIAFIRVVSGRFDREMTVTHVQTGRRMRLANAQALFGRERETIDEAFAGDVIGVVGGRDVRIGDTFTDDPSIVYDEIPRFPPECFAWLHNPSPAQYKRFEQGVTQLLQEGVVQRFGLPQRRQKVALLGAVGPLQFEIVQYRLESEYGAESRLETAPWSVVRWFAGDLSPQQVLDLKLPTGVETAQDPFGQPVVLFADPWQERFFTERNPEIELMRRPAKAPRDSATAPAS